MEKTTERGPVMEKQQAFISTVKQALGRTEITGSKENIFTTVPSDAEKRILAQMKGRTAEERQTLLKKLREVAGPLHVDLHEHGSLAEAAAGIADLVLKKNPEWGTEKHVCRWDHPLINELGLESLPQLKDVPIYTAPTAPDGASLSAAEKERFRQQVELSFIGITSADHCAAATATLTLRSRPGLSRSVSLVPSIHIAVIEAKQLLANLEELYTLLKWDPKEREKGLTNNLSLVSGPSKTGDIELIMVHGAHGPRELHLFILSDKE